LKTIGPSDLQLSIGHN